jgi:PAS domain S-box-containing protein
MYLEAITLLLGYKLLKRDCSNFRPWVSFISLLSFTVILIFLIFSTNVFPDILNQYYEPTLFKKITQYFIIVLFILAGVLFYKIRKNIDYLLFMYIEHAIAARIISLIIFAISWPYDELSVVLHVAKLMSFYYIYKGFIEIGLKNPYKHLYYELSETNRKLHRGNVKIKQMEEELLNNEDFYNLLINNSKDIIVVYSEGKIKFVNEQAMKLIEIDSLEEIIDNSVDELIAEEELERVLKRVNEIYREKIFVNSYEMKLKTKTGKKVPVETSGVYFIYKGKPAIAAILRDVSYKKQVEELKRDAEISTKLLNESREYNKLITEFMANISHELRTPLNVILSAVQIMSMPSLNIEVKKEKYLGIVKLNSYRLLRLVNNLIDISRIDSGYLKLNLQKSDIISAVESITLSVAEYIEDKGVELIFDTDEEERIIAFDYDKIERILLNLLANAVKFTKEKDSILVSVINKEQSVIISVKDTGIGIPEDKLNIIFERFRQVDKSFTRSHEGSGIGLALVKSLVEMHFGTIEVSSILGKGTEFIITFPADLGVDEVSERDINHVTNTEKISIEFSDIYM